MLHKHYRGKKNENLESKKWREKRLKKKEYKSSEKVKRESDEDLRWQKDNRKVLRDAKELNKKKRGDDVGKGIDAKNSSQCISPTKP